jgi:hypothetical protein
MGWATRRPLEVSMSFIALLWLPILVSAAVVFALSAASHMFLPWRLNEHARLPGHEAVQAAVRDLPAGQYGFPFEEDPRQRGSKIAMERWAAGPSGWLTIVPRRPIAMGRNLALSFLVNLVVSFLAAYLAAFALGDAPERIAITRVVSVVGVLAYGVGTCFNSIWYARPWRAYAADLLDAVVQGFAMALVFAWLWPR